ncbi:MAG: hypothetical protein LBB88_12250 [Planctomycetaceae bacterium]|jgi:hypothetical protein|nr:hypothetical protein [Planctomycetaceae bacterium]
MNLFFVQIKELRFIVRFVPKEIRVPIRLKSAALIRERRLPENKPAWITENSSASSSKNYDDLPKFKWEIIPDVIN